MNSLGAANSEDLQPGVSATLAKSVTEAAVVLFAGVSTDVDPVHLDEEFAKTTPFGGRNAHGMLAEASFRLRSATSYRDRAPFNFDKR